MTQILTDDEIWALASGAWPQPLPHSPATRSYARAVEAAVLAKLEPRRALADAVVNAARRAMGASRDHDNTDDISLYSKDAASLSLSLDEYDAAAKAEGDAA